MSRSQDKNIKNNQIPSTTNAVVTTGTNNTLVSDVVDDQECTSQPRRTLLKVALGTTLASPAWSTVSAATPERTRPQPGDAIVIRFGDNRGKAVIPGDVPDGAELLSVSAMDITSKVIRDGSRLNGINMVRLDPAVINDETKPFSVDGIVAYSSVCTHQGCDLTQWLPDSKTFKCYCHYSEFNAAELGEPNHGPARRNLAILPLAVNDAGEFVVAEKFNGKVGFKRK